jgi:hypothetical protein
MPLMASVVRKDGMPMRVVSQPLKQPTAMPVAIPAKTPAKGPATAMAMATVTVVRPATAPMLRSISPDDSTKVMATAITAIIAVWRMMFKRLVGFRNPLSARVTAKTAKITTKPI